MKLIRIQAANSAVRLPLDRKNPSPTPPIQDIITAIQARYQFSMVSQLTSQHLQGAPIPLQAGRFLIGDKVHRISQLMVLQQGDIVTAEDTDIGDAILDDLLQFLDQSFGGDLVAQVDKRLYVTGLVVEFSKSFEGRNKFLRDAEKITKMPFTKMVFSTERNFPAPGPEAAALLSSDPLLQMELTEFSIERRAGEPFSANRYFSIAPLRTKDHIAALEKIEALL
jgi:hypothetical protein